MAPHVCRSRIVDGIATNSFIERVVWRMQSGVICVVRQIFGCGVWRRKSDTNCINPCRARFVIETVIYRRKLWGPSIFVNRCLWDDMASIKRHVNDANYSELVWIKSLTVWQKGEDWRLHHFAKMLSFVAKYASPEVYGCRNHSTWHVAKYGSQRV